MEQNEDTLVQSSSPPHKKARLEITWGEDDLYFDRIRRKHLILSVYENVMNCMIEQSGIYEAIDELEDEAVAMAIRAHGLTTSGPTSGLEASVSESTSKKLEQHLQEEGPCCSSSSRDSVLSQAVSVAIKKKGLGATDR